MDIKFVRRLAQTTLSTASGDLKGAVDQGRLTSGPPRTRKR